MKTTIKWILFVVKVITIILPIIGHTFQTIKEEYRKLKNENNN